MRKVLIDLALLEKLYAEDKLSIVELAKRFSVSNNTISRRLTEAGVKKRTMSEIKMDSKFKGFCYTCNKESKISICKKCRDKAYYEKNKDKILEQAKAYRDLIKDTEKYKSYHKQYSRENKEKVREYKRINRSKRRAIMKEGSFSIRDWRDILKNQKGICVYCLKESKLTIEHKTPLSRGGKHEKSNICGACLSCNVKKHTQTAEEFLRSKGD